MDKMIPNDILLYHSSNVISEASWQLVEADAEAHNQILQRRDQRDYRSQRDESRTQE